MDRTFKKTLTRKLVKETPKIHLLDLLEKLGSVGLERNIFVGRFIEKKSPKDIGVENNISHNTYFRVYDDLIIKINKLIK